jgi:hypothetical protein
MVVSWSVPLELISSNKKLLATTNNLSPPQQFFKQECKLVPVTASRNHVAQTRFLVAGLGILLIAGVVMLHFLNKPKIVRYQQYEGQVAGFIFQFPVFKGLEDISYEQQDYDTSIMRIQDAGGTTRVIVKVARSTSSPDNQPEGLNLAGRQLVRNYEEDDGLLHRVEISLTTPDAKAQLPGFSSKLFFEHIDRTFISGKGTPSMKNWK